MTGQEKPRFRQTRSMATAISAFAMDLLSGYCLPFFN
jgi:hypothetical protein